LGFKHSALKYAAHAPSVTHYLVHHKFFYIKQPFSKFSIYLIRFVNQKNKMLENSKVNIKIKLSALWTSVLFCYVYGDYFELYVPEKVEGLLNGVNMLDSPTKLLIASLVLAIPAVMIPLSILLNPKINRFLNLSFGFLFTLMMLLIAINSLTPWYSFYVFLAILESLITIIIVWFAWNWPRKISE